MQGVPLRVEIGPKELAERVTTLRQRVGDGKRIKLPFDDAWSGAVVRTLADVHAGMLARARQRLRDRTLFVTEYSTMRTALGGASHSLTGPAFFLAPWREDDANEQAVKAECKATLRCFPSEHQAALAPDAVCFYSGKPANRIALFARAF